jgi:hypothetical protein
VLTVLTVLGSPARHPDRNVRHRARIGNAASECKAVPDDEDNRLPRYPTPWEDHLGGRRPDASRLAGEGGVGKTRVIRAVELGFELLQRKEEVLLLAPMGAASYNIGGRTIHDVTAPVLQSNCRPTTYGVWRGKTTLFIDEINMVSLTMLNMINEHCNKIRALPQDSMAILGALPIVVFMGDFRDFHQFAPIKAQPLWQTPNNPRAVIGRLSGSATCSRRGPSAATAATVGGSNASKGDGCLHSGCRTGPRYCRVGLTYSSSMPSLPAVTPSRWPTRPNR